MCSDNIVIRSEYDDDAIILIPYTQQPYKIDGSDIAEMVRLHFRLDKLTEDDLLKAITDYTRKRGKA